MNDTLGNVGKTVVYTRTVEAEPVNQLESISDLAADMKSGKVDLLVIVGGNPVYSAPVDLEFADAMNKAQLRVHLSLYNDETSALCQWQIPETHFLEAWSDARGYDGTVSIVQPLIAPLYGGKSAHEVLAAMSERPERSGHDLVREFWSTQDGARVFQPRERGPALRRAQGTPSSSRVKRRRCRARRRRNSMRRGGAGCTTASCRTLRSRQKKSASPNPNQSAIRNPQSAMASTGLEISFRTIHQYWMAGLVTTAGCRSSRSRSRD
jgi:anaerobic selenocysteine-containing dehydrogenase